MLPSLVFVFESFDNQGAHNTPEVILLNSTLQLGLQGKSKGASELGTHGMSRPGKTSAFKRICNITSVQLLLVDGVSLMQFGQDLTLQRVRAEICRCVKEFFGEVLEKKMKDTASLWDAVNRAAD